MILLSNKRQIYVLGRKIRVPDDPVTKAPNKASVPLLKSHWGSPFGVRISLNFPTGRSMISTAIVFMGTCLFRRRTATNKLTVLKDFVKHQSSITENATYIIWRTGLKTSV